jgi:hypothetical protein
LPSLPSLSPARIRRAAVAFLSLLAACAAASSIRAASAPLRRNPENPRTFLYGSKPVFLVGDYPAIASFVDADVIGGGSFDWKRFLDVVSGEGVNLVRQVFSMGEQPADNPRALVPWVRSGPGKALDGRPKYDLDRFDPRLFDRFRAAARYARKKGVFLQIILFDCWDIKADVLDSGWGWRYDAFNGANNVQGLDATSGEDGANGFTDLKNARLLGYQEALMRKVADTLKDEPNVCFEVANENYYHPDWESRLADDLTDYEKSKDYLVHLVMPRDLPHHGVGGLERFEPERVRQATLSRLALRQPLIDDSDGAGMPPRGTVRRWAWTAFVSGGTVSYLDESWNSWFGNHDSTGSARSETRKDLGRLRHFAEKFRFWKLSPLTNAVSGGDAMAFGTADDRTLLIYSASGGAFSLKGLPDGAAFRARWYDPRKGVFLPAERRAVKAEERFVKPDEEDWALALERTRR